MRVLTRRAPASTGSAHPGASRSVRGRTLGVSGQVVQAKLRIGPQDDPLDYWRWHRLGYPDPTYRTEP